MSTTLNNNGSTHANAAVTLVDGNNSCLPTSNLLLNSNSCISSNSNQLSTINLHQYNNMINQGMKENIFFSSINQIHTSNSIAKQGLVNSSTSNVAFIQPTTQHLPTNLMQHSNISHPNSNLTQFQPQGFHQNQPPITNVRYKNSNVNSSMLNTNNQTVYRSYNNSNCRHQVNSHYQLINSHLINNGTTTNSNLTTNNCNNTGNILLNISNHNNHTNNHYNQHSNNANFNVFNGYQLNYHVQQSGNLGNHVQQSGNLGNHHYHINSLSSSPRSSTSSNSSTSSSIMNYHTTNNDSSNKYQNGQNSPTSSISSIVLSTQNHHSTNSNHISASNKSTNKTNTTNTTNTSITTTNPVPVATTQKSKHISNTNNYRLHTSNGHGSPTNSASHQHSTQHQQNGTSSRYKTELCRPFEESGFCKYSDKCQYAHGQNELRSLQRHPKYKTELCRTFHTTGFCPYGPRCHFIHNNDGNVFSKKDNLIMDQFNSSSNTPSNDAIVTVQTKTNNCQNTSITLNHNIDVDSSSATSSTSSGLGGSLSPTNSTSTNSSEVLSPQQSIFANLTTDQSSVSVRQATSSKVNLDNLQRDLNLKLSSNLMNGDNQLISPTKKVPLI